MFNAHVSESFERPSRHVMDIPVWLDTLVCQLLEKKPEHRPYDAAMVAKVLEDIEQKVADQRSAGVDAAIARTPDRGRKRPADETDRAAARTLRGAVSKRKLRKKAVPLVNRSWFRAMLLAAGLAGVAGALFWFTLPAGEDEMYRRAKAAVDSNDPDQALEATEHYLTRFAGRDNIPRLGEVKDWNRGLWVQKREQQLHNRFISKLNLAPDDDGQKLAFQAFKRENAGELDDAAQTWRELEDKFKGTAEPEPAVYSWVAQKKLADLKSLSNRFGQLQVILDQEHAFNPPDRKTELVGAAKGSFEAMRLEAFGDSTAARDRWERVREEHVRDKDLAQRIWVVLAADHSRWLRATITVPKDKEKGERLVLLQKRLDEADAVPPMADPNDLKHALSIYRDLRDLYGSDPDPAVTALRTRRNNDYKESSGANGGEIDARDRWPVHDCAGLVAERHSSARERQIPGGVNSPARALERSAANHRLLPGATAHASSTLTAIGTSISWVRGAH